MLIKKIKTIRNLEFGQLYQRSLEITERFSPEELHIKAAYDKARASVELCDLLMIKSSKQPMTLEQMDAKSKMLDSSIRLMKKMRLLRFEPGDSHPKGFNDFFNFINTHLNAIRNIKIVRQVALIQGFIDAVEAKPIHLQMMEALQLMPYYTKLKEDFELFTGIYDIRQQAKEDKQVGVSLGARRRLNNLLRQLYHEIESAVVLYPGVDYSRLISELNGEIAMSQSRTALKPKSAETSADDSQHVVA